MFIHLNKFPPQDSFTPNKNGSNCNKDKKVNRKDFALAQCELALNRILIYVDSLTNQQQQMQRPNNVPPKMPNEM